MTVRKSDTRLLKINHKKNMNNLEPIKDILMKRDGLSEAEAESEIRQAQDEFDQLIAEGNISEAYEVCSTWFALEPDYIEEFIY